MTGVVSPDSFGISLSLMFLLMVVIGGAGTVVGPVLGASLIGVLPLLLTSYPNISSYIYGGVLIVVVRLLPRGLIPRTGMRVRERRHKTDAASLAPLAGATTLAPSSPKKTGTLGPARISSVRPILEVREISRHFSGNLRSTRSHSI